MGKIKKEMKMSILKVLRKGERAATFKDVSLAKIALLSTSSLESKEVK